jgi:hypothetical protein
MTLADWICAGFGGAAAAAAHHYYRKWASLVVLLGDLRQALRERDAAEREPMKLAFQAGYKVGHDAARAEALH